MIKYRTRLGLCGEETKTVDNPEDGKLTALQTAIDGIQNNMDILTVLPLFKSYDEQLMDLGVDPKYAEDKEMLLNYEQWFTGLMNK
ncbi:MAG: hypothetical protein Q8O99_05855 [bacterium]|nr:hypothetical protein [bacterium]